jgi:glycine/D-amino acid oxidase-like deaminating enzyme
LFSHPTTAAANAAASATDPIVFSMTRSFPAHPMRQMDATQDAIPLTRCATVSLGRAPAHSRNPAPALFCGWACSALSPYDELRMDLTTGCPFWPIRDGLIATYPPLARDAACDVAIVGGGMTGAFIAQALCAAGVDVVLFDKRDVGMGSTASCTGLLQYEIDTPLHVLADRIGEDKAVRSYLLCLGALEKIDRMTEIIGDDCGFARRKSLQIASSPRGEAALEKEHAARTACGIRLDLLGPRDVRARFPFTAPAALLSHDAGEIDAYRLTHALLRHATGNGLRCFDRMRVTTIDHGPRRSTLRTDRGPRVSAKKVVFATGYETRRYLRDPRVTLRTTYALASEPVASFDGWAERCLIWETKRPYFYARTCADDRAMIGGADEDFINPDDHTALLPRKESYLKRRFAKLFPSIAFETAYRWAGVFGETDDGLPFIGDCAKVPNSYFAVGYGGNGITYSVLAAEIIRDLFLQRPNRDARLFCFDR